MTANKLRAAMIEKGYSVDRLANLFGISKQTMYRKLKNPGGFTIKEANELKELLELSDIQAIDIFLT